MPSIRIESKNVVFNGQDTGYNHAYLLLDDNDVPDSADVQIRGGDGANGRIVIQAGLTIEDSLDARRDATPEDRGDRIVSSSGADDQWAVMTQAVSEIAAAGITYTFPGSGVPVQNSNSVVATLLHTIGYDIHDTLPGNASMADLTGSETILDFSRTLTGGAGDDTIVGWHQDDMLKGGAGRDALYGDAGNDTLYGNQGDDHLIGGIGDDHLDGGQGNDHLEGGAGSDVLEGGLGDDVLDGGDGSDTATYLHIAGGSTSTGVTVDLHLEGQAQETHLAGMDTLTGVENLYGSNFADTLTGDGSVNIIQGGAGDDAIVGAGGADGLFGNVGDDLIQGGDGDDVVNGGQGNDRLFGNVGDDSIHGGIGDDYINGGQGSDILYGDAGSNTLVGGLGADSFVMSLAGHDTIADYNEAAGDKIDLTGIDAITGNAATGDPFTYVAGGAFGSVAGQLIVVATDATHFQVEGDTDGDGVPDFTVDVTSIDGAPDRNAFINLADAGATKMALHVIAHEAFLFA